MVIRARATYDNQPFNRDRSVLFTELYNDYQQAVRQIRKDLRLAIGKDNTEFSKKFVIEAKRLKDLIGKMSAVAERKNETFGEDLLLAHFVTKFLCCDSVTSKLRKRYQAPQHNYLMAGPSSQICCGALIEFKML